MTRKIKQRFYISDETKVSHVCANVPRYNKRLYELKCINIFQAHLALDTRCMFPDFDHNLYKILIMLHAHFMH